MHITFNIIDEYFIRQLLIDNGSHVTIAALVLLESASSEIVDPEVNARHVAPIRTVDISLVWDGNTPKEVCFVHGILCVDIDLSPVDAVELLLPQEGHLAQGWLLVPVQPSAILLQDPEVRHVRVIIFIHGVGDIGAQDVPVKGDKQLSREISVVAFRLAETCLPQ